MVAFVGPWTAAYDASVRVANPELVVRLVGHTNYDEESALGQKRAELVKDKLTERGVAEERLETSNAAFTMPLLSKEIIEELPTQLERQVANQRNRRVEVSVARTTDDEGTDH